MAASAKRFANGAILANTPVECGQPLVPLGLLITLPAESVTGPLLGRGISTCSPATRVPIIDECHVAGGRSGGGLKNGVCRAKDP